MESERAGRYTLFGQLGSGGMAAVYLARDVSAGASTPPVAIKRLHAHIASLPSSIAAFLDEARVTERIRHPNVVALLDIVSDDHELALVMEYVHGVALAHLSEIVRRRSERVPLPIAARIVSDMLRGLEAAHVATDENGQPLGIVHRDVSPQNVLVGADGVTRLLDFGIAKGSVRLQTTRDDELKGKLRYMAPEQLQKDEVTPLADVYATAVVLWELLTGEKLFVASSEGATMAKVLEGIVAAPSALRPEAPASLDAIVLRCLSRTPADRLPSCAALADAIGGAVAVAAPHDVAEWVSVVASDFLNEREALVRAVEDGRVGGAFVPNRKTTSDETATLAPARSAAAAAPSVRSTRSEEPVVRRRPGPLVVAVLSAVGAVVIGVGVWSARQSSAGVMMPASASGAPTVVAAPSTSPAESASADASELPPPSAAPAPHPPRPTIPRPRPDPCKPRYVTGADGIRRVKPECL